MTGFSKLDSSIIHSTIWREPNHIRIVWITMLAMSDAKGRVMASIPGLADAARVSIDECTEALECFMSADKWSRDEDNEGRRIEEIRGGWRILNYMKYRDPTSTERVREWRKRKASDETVATVSNGCQPRETASEADPEADKRSVGDKSPTPQSIDLPLGDKKISSPSQPIVLTSETKKKRSGTTGKGVATWEAYSEAYRSRYGVLPERNAQTNTLCCTLVKLLGADKAPSVAAYYLTSSKAYYVSRRHPLKALVADAQSMCTEWQTGERMTQHQAREADRLQSTGDDWREIKAMHMEKDNHD